MKKYNFIGYGELTWDVNFDECLNIIKQNGGRYYMEYSFKSW